MVVTSQRPVNGLTLQVIQADEHSICMLLRTPASQQAAAAMLEERQQEAGEDERRDEFAGLPGAGQPQAGTSAHNVDAHGQQWGWLVGPPIGSGKGGLPVPDSSRAAVAQRCMACLHVVGP